MHNSTLKPRKLRNYLRKKKILILLFFVLILILIPTLLIIDNEFARGNTEISNITESDDNLRLMTFNIHQYWDEKDLLLNLNGLIDLISTEQIDIIGFQEMWLDNVSYIAKQLNMYYYNNSLTNQNTFHGLALLSKFPILESYSVELNNSPINGVRAMIWSKIRFNNQNLTVFVTHVDTPSTYFSQLNQVKQINNIIKKYTDFILFCDCNAPDTILLESYRILTENLEDGWIASGKFSFEGRTWPSDFPFLRVDYIWLSKNDWHVIKDSGKIIGNSSYSDHLGVRIIVIKK